MWQQKSRKMFDYSRFRNFRNDYAFLGSEINDWKNAT